jgi:hypothetical protein
MNMISSDVGARTQDILIFDLRSGSKNGSSQEVLDPIGTGDAFR